MTASSAPALAFASTRPRSRIGFGRVMLTAVHLAAIGIVGSALLGVVLGLFGAGLGTVVVFGIGVVILVGLVYLLYGISWFEVERVNALYRLGTEPLQRRPRHAPGFAGWLRAIARQSVDGRMWRAQASFWLATLFGLAVLWLAQSATFWAFAAVGGASRGVVNPLRLSGFSWLDWTLRPAGAAVMAVVALAAIIGLSALHATIARGLLGSVSRSALAAEVRTKSAQREGAVRAAEVERTRIERDLHDGVQPRLVSIGMTLGLAQKKIEEDPAAAKALISEAHASTKAAITELRQLARGIHVSVLDDRGLDAALSALAGRSHIPVHLDVQLEHRPSGDVHAYRNAEAALYFSIAEALTNAAKHSRASECRVTVHMADAGAEGARLCARIDDNGIGGAEVQPGGGLDGISNRVLATGGTFTLHSPQGGPTSLEVSVPCAF